VDDVGSAVPGLILALLLAARPAAAEEPPEAADAPAATDPVASFALELDEAKALWFRGEADLAYEKLRQLYLRARAGEPVPLPLAGECAIYLGEIEIERGSVDGAEEVWRWLLQRDPAYPISPYHHPFEVIGKFEVVRKQVVDALPPPAPLVLERYPAWGYVPFGVPQFQQGRPVRGAVYLGGQALFAGASIGLFVNMILANPDPGYFPGEHPLGWAAADATERLIDRKYRLQWPATFGFYGLWVVSVLDGQATFRRSPSEPGAQAPMTLPVGIAGRW